MNRALFAVSFIGFATSLFVRVIDPVVPQISADFGIPAADVALLATAFALPFAFVQPLLGPLGDSVGKTKMIMFGISLLAISTLVGAFAPNFTVLLVSRIIAGAATGAIFPAGLAFVADSADVEKRQVLLARYVTAALTGNLGGAWIGGIIADLTNWRGVLITASCCGAGAFLVGLWGFRHIKNNHGPRFDLAFAASTYRRIFSNPRAKFCFLGVLLEGTAIHGLMPFIAVLLHQSGEARASIAGFVIAAFAIGGAALGLFISGILRRLGSRGMMIVGALLTACMLCAAALRLEWQYESVIFFFMGIGFYMMHNCFQLAVSEIAPVSRGSAMSLHACFFFIGQATGPLFYYWGFAHLGIVATLFVAAATILFTGVMGAQTLFPRTKSASS